MTNNQLIELTKKFSGKKIIVIGDFAVDAYVYCSSIGMSREVPILVSKEEEHEYKGGCCANIACNIQSLGGKVYVMGLVGKDSEGDFLIKHFNELGMNTDYLKQTEKRSTSRLIRYMVKVAHSGYQQSFRCDRKEIRDLSEDDEKYLIESIKKLENEGFDTIVIGDYGGGYNGEGEKGIITKDILKTITNSKLLSIGDSRYRTSELKGISYIFPNDYEALLALDRNLAVSPHGVLRELDEDEVVKVGLELLKKLENKSLVITRGASGMSIFEKDKPMENIPTYAQKIFDVTGAGDTVTAAAAIALSNGASIVDAAKIANYAAAIVIRKPGTATASQEELIKEIENNKK